MRIQVPIDSRNSAIQHAYHTLLHPSSSSQPRHPMLKIVVTNRVNSPEDKEHFNASTKQSDAQTQPPEQQQRQLQQPTWQWPTSLNVCVWQQQSSSSTQPFTSPNHCGTIIHVQMILPQVHLRKPCYDFSFL